MAIAAGVLLALYFCGIVFAICVPPRQPDPQRGIALGCLSLVAGGIAGLGAVLAAGVYFDLTWCVHIAFDVAIFPAVLLLIALARAVVIRVLGWK